MGKGTYHCIVVRPRAVVASVTGRVARVKSQVHLAALRVGSTAETLKAGVQNFGHLEAARELSRKEAG